MTSAPSNWPLYSKLDNLTATTNSLAPEDSITHLKSNVSNMKSDITDMKSDVASMVSMITTMKSDVTTMRTHAANISKTMAASMTKLK